MWRESPKIYSKAVSWIQYDTDKRNLVTDVEGLSGKINGHIKTRAFDDDYNGTAENCVCV